MVHPVAIPTTELMEDIDDDTLTFDPDDIFQIINQWTTISRLEIYGIDEPFDDLFPRPELSNYLESLNNLSSLVLYGIGAATSVAHTLFLQEKPLLPNLSRFLLAISPNTGNDLSDYLVTRQRYRLPRLQKISINFGYFRQLSNFSSSCATLQSVTLGKIILKGTEVVFFGRKKSGSRIIRLPRLLDEGPDLSQSKRKDYPGCRAIICNFSNELSS